ncbi:MAG: response regulator [Rhodospirillales bacterium]|nr:response regulator [Rhodospirillales bacterium]
MPGDEAVLDPADQRAFALGAKTKLDFGAQGVRCEIAVRLKAEENRVAEAGRVLSGRRVLVVEDEYMVAADIARALEDDGANVAGPAGSIQEALELIAAESRIDGAVLDINLRGQLAYPIADALRARGVPFIFATGYDARIIPEAYADAPRVEKPVNISVIARLLFTSSMRLVAG